MNFEFIAALLMQRMYEQQWNAPTMIGFYMKLKYHDEFSKNASPSFDFMMDALENGIDENNPIDFTICTADGSAGQQFQLKRFGLNGDESTEALIEYINTIKTKYAPIDAACIIAICDIEIIDFLRLSRGIEKNDFPFKELLLIGATSGDGFLVFGILPNEGWSAFRLAELVN